MSCVLVAHMDWTKIGLLSPMVVLPILTARVAFLIIFTVNF